MERGDKPSATAVASIAEPVPARLFAGIDWAQRRVLVAVSGGSDSLALLLLLSRHLAASGGFPPVAVTVDHRLRPEAAEEAREVGRTCARIGVEHRVAAWEGTKPATGLSEAAREARHRLLAEAASQLGADFVVTGHTLDDQAETVAMRLRRGAGRGEAGIAPATLFSGRCWFVRPLLGIRRAALRQFLNGIGQDWVEDPSNEDRRFERARLRPQLGEHEIEDLAARAAKAAAAREEIGRRAARLIAFHASMAAPGLVRLDPAFAREQDHEASLYALRILLATVGGTPQLPETGSTATLFARLAHAAGRATLSRAVVDMRKGGMFLHREGRGLPRPRPFAADGWDGRFRLEGVAPGAVVAPSGSETAPAEAGEISVPNLLLRAAHAARPALWRDGEFVSPLEAEGAKATAVPLVAPWARYLPSFDLEPARAVTRLVRAAPVPPPPFARHNRSEA